MLDPLGLCWVSGTGRWSQGRALSSSKDPGVLTARSPSLTSRLPLRGAWSVHKLPLDRGGDAHEQH